jgi:hypothetical protein
LRLDPVATAPGSDTITSDTNSPTDYFANNENYVDS